MNKAAVVWAALLFVCTISCDETYTAKNAQKIPNDSIISTRLFNAKMTIKDSGYTDVKLTSPIVEMYELIDTPYVVFPMGLELNYFQKKSSKPGFLRCSYAKVIEKTGYHEAKGNVIVISDKGDSLKTQQLFWDKRKRTIFCPDTTEVILADGTYNRAIGGMKASDDFKEIEFLNNSGKVIVKD